MAERDCRPRERERTLRFLHQSLRLRRLVHLLRQPPSSHLQCRPRWRLSRHLSLRCRQRSHRHRRRCRLPHPHLRMSCPQRSHCHLRMGCRLPHPHLRRRCPQPSHSHLPWSRRQRSQHHPTMRCRQRCFHHLRATRCRLRSRHHPRRRRARDTASCTAGRTERRSAHSCSPDPRRSPEQTRAGAVEPASRSHLTPPLAVPWGFHIQVTTRTSRSPLRGWGRRRP